MSEANKPPAALLGDIGKGADLKKTGKKDGDAPALAHAKMNMEVSKGVDLKKTGKADGDDPALAQAKMQLAVKKGVDLKKTDAPSAEPSDAVKEAFIADQKEKK